MEEKLSCGGKGPCCHIDYAHSHCEHCGHITALDRRGQGFLDTSRWTEAMTTVAGSSRSVNSGEGGR